MIFCEVCLFLFFFSSHFLPCFLPILDLTLDILSSNLSIEDVYRMWEVACLVTTSALSSPQRIWLFTMLHVIFTDVPPSLEQVWLFSLSNTHDVQSE